jgi:hypothetical protein
MNDAEVNEKFKRLIAFTGLRIIDVEVGEMSIIIHVKFGRKKQRLEFVDNELILYDSEGKEVMRMQPNYNNGIKNPIYKQPNIQVTPYAVPLTAPNTVPYYPTYPSTGGNPVDPSGQFIVRSDGITGDNLVTVTNTDLQNNSYASIEDTLKEMGFKDVLDLQRMFKDIPH